jgi:hypothetical protein
VQPGSGFEDGELAVGTRKIAESASQARDETPRRSSTRTLQLGVDLCARFRHWMARVPRFDPKDSGVQLFDVAFAEETASVEVLAKKNSLKKK